MNCRLLVKQQVVMPSLFVIPLCKIKWQDSVAEKANARRICFLPKGCWRLPILFPKKKKKKKVKSLLFSVAQKTKFPPLEGRNCVHALKQIGNGGMKNRKCRLDCFMRAWTVVFLNQTKAKNWRVSLNCLNLPRKEKSLLFGGRYFVLVLIQTTGSPKWGLDEVN